MHPSTDASTAEQIHEASLALLDDPGIQIDHEEILGLLVAHGARPGARSGLVRLPRRLVEESVAQCPSRVALANRRGEARVLTPEGPSTIWSTPGMYRARGRSRVPFTTRDMARHARLLEQLESVDVVFGLSLDDVPPPARDVVGLQTIAANTSKHVRVLCFSPEGMDVMVRMRSVVGDHPWFSMGFTAHGPLRWTRLALEIFRRSAGHGIPATVNGEPMAGASGPVTLAGSAAVGNAEILAGLVVNQLLEPGRPCIYNLGLAHVMDMRAGIAVTGGPENALFARLSALMGRFYRIPSASWVSTEAMCCDAQAALEKTFGWATHLASGVSAVWGVGQLESEMTVCPAMAVVDDEAIRYARRYLAGAEVSDETLAVQVTREVGAAGSFLDHAHTLRHFRSELFEPRVLLRQRHDPWRAAGSPTLTERAAARARELAARRVDTGMTPDQAAELRRMAREFVRAVGAPEPQASSNP